MLRGLGHEQSPEQSQMWGWAGPAPDVQDELCLPGLQLDGISAQEGEISFLGDFQGDFQRDFQGYWGQSGQCWPSCCSSQRGDERVGFGPALFLCLMLLPLFLSLISPPGPWGAVRTWQIPNPAHSVSWGSL